MTDNLTRLFNLVEAAIDPCEIPPPPGGYAFTRLPDRQDPTWRITRAGRLIGWLRHRPDAPAMEATQ